ncbi:cell wall-binding repeat-containing protein [Clostridium sp. JS66]|uniref:cell wall-binding repeat-containing protein n=1 Tax=Clostridium sp. JS66 TaxID=3064705 RepID=UPI00298DE085|nr:cell wall-binding repeat-containing protein [Clostridium sp. JS66]WPC44538.1 cell wall-binding repeat-containing protein [Clostridium sp. JS66]
MNKSVITILVGIFMAGIITTSVDAQGNTTRLAGQTRYDTCKAVSSSGWSTAENVIIANGENYPDALGASALSYKYKAPIILVQGNSMQDNPVLVSELNRLKPKNIIILGGKGVVSNDIENSLKKSGYNLKRLSGQDRYSTAVNIAKELGDVDEIFIANGDDFSGSLSAAPMSAKDNAPVLLVSKDEVPNVVQAYLKEHNVKNTYVLGDESLISEAVANEFTGVKRISGNAPYSLNENIIDNFKADINFNTIYITSGEGFADALSAVGLAVKNGNPIIFAGNSDNNHMNKLLQEEVVENKVILGGEGVLPISKVNNLFQQQVVVDKDDNDATNAPNRRQFLIGDAEKDGTFAKLNGSWQYTTKEAKQQNIESINIKVWDYVDKNDKSRGKKTVIKSIEVNKKLSSVVKQIFDEIYALPQQFPIDDVGGFRDSDSCINHPAGAAIDINPDENYYIQLDKDGKVQSQVGNYYKPSEDPYSITPEIVKVFQKYKWDWGGNFKNPKDYMHFSYLGG